VLPPIGASPNRLNIGRATNTNNGLLVFIGATGGTGQAVPIASDTPVTLAVTYDTTTYRAFLNGALSHNGSFTGTVLETNGSLTTLGGVSGVDYDVTVESALYFDVPLSDTDVLQISSIPAAWTWDNVQIAPATIMPIARFGTQMTYLGPLRVGRN
jgi:hypothetical protein